MNEKQANKILGVIKERDGGLFTIKWDLAWLTYTNINKITLYGQFAADELEAVAWWLRNKSNKVVKPTVKYTSIKED